MNSKLVDSLAQIIQSLSEEEQKLLEEKMKTKSAQKATQSQPLQIQEKPFYETATAEEWIAALREWSESHSRDTPLLSDEAVSRRGIYEEI